MPGEHAIVRRASNNLYRIMPHAANRNFPDRVSISETFAEPKPHVELRLDFLLFAWSPSRFKFDTS